MRLASTLTSLMVRKETETVPGWFFGDRLRCQRRSPPSNMRGALRSGWHPRCTAPRGGHPASRAPITRRIRSGVSPESCRNSTPNSPRCTHWTTARSITTRGSRSCRGKSRHSSSSVPLAMPVVLEIRAPRGHAGPPRRPPCRPRKTISGSARDSGGPSSSPWSHLCPLDHVVDTCVRRRLRRVHCGLVRGTTGPSREDLLSFGGGGSGRRE
jgi:hypothetical protein